jgi:hypothetical protein
MIEVALRQELIKAIPEFQDQIYPTNAPETATKPYLVYARLNTRRTKTFEGYTNKQALTFMFSIMAIEYPDMYFLTRRVEDFLLRLPKKHIGNQQIYIEDININNVSEQYEHELKVNRGIIDFTIYF